MCMDYAPTTVTTMDTAMYTIDVSVFSEMMGLPHGLVLIAP
jgi:hypothetical protein